MNCYNFKTIFISINIYKQINFIKIIHESSFILHSNSLCIWK